MKSIKLGLVYPPRLALIEGKTGRNWSNAMFNGSHFSVMAVAGTLLDHVESIEVHDLSRGSDEVEYGDVNWEEHTFTKTAVGGDWRTINPHSCDVWGITSNFHSRQGIVCEIIRYLAASGVPVIVGGSDAKALPQVYIDAGASVVVLDKSGGSNVAAVEYVVSGKTELPHDLYTHSGYMKEGRPRLHPEEWVIPSNDIIKRSLGTPGYYEDRARFMSPVGMLAMDHGCDRACDYCMTPTYKLGYQKMSVERLCEWFDAMVTAGARSIDSASDQFLLRLLYEGGREEVMRITSSMRDRGLNWMWQNGLELSKATLGKGLPGGDMTPDRELIKSIWGWDNRSGGCTEALIPSERPGVETRERYAKMLPWQEHVDLIKSAVEVGLSSVNYSCVFGVEEDTHESFDRFFEAIYELREALYTVNPDVHFLLYPNIAVPFPGTPLYAKYRKMGLIEEKVDPALFNKWTPVARTRSMSIQELSDRQSQFFNEFVGGAARKRRGITAFDQVK